MDQMKIIKQRVDEFVASAKAQRDNKDRNFLMENIGKEIGANLMPLMKTMADNTRLNKADFVELTTYLKSELAKVEIPMPNIVMPDIPAPIVNYTPPAIKIPDIKMPDEMNVKGWVSLMGVSLEKPLPVQMRNADGSPVDWSSISAMGGGGGRSGGNVKVTGFDASALYQAGVINGDGRLKVETNDSGGSTQIVDQLSGANWSVAVKEIFGSTITTLLNGDNRIPVSVETGVSGLTDAELRASAVPVIQVSGASWSVSAIQVTSPWVVSATDLDVRDLNVTQDELLVHQVSGSSWSVSLSTALSDVTDTIGTQQVSGAIDSTQVKLIARQTNPTAASDAASTFASSDDLGRQLVRPIQARDLIATAYATFATGTEATLLAGTAGAYNDLIYVLAANNSTAALGIDIRPSTAGSIVMHLEIPANGVVGVSTPVPIPQQATGDGTGGSWTVDLPDITGTTVSVSALFSREI